ncbi:hypothetical protein SAMD00020551_1153 [Mesobacillus selenatarsenatis SF-1]|uniref:Uncharacterized protein n=1 Tax=Mesobacillus selenatarsenatis (strain DSM 18680 / JCM 14380 / FERM P-15431 / SF-1) TaxID=1321606 RepID=A0A0A8WZD7_MESS1|nr:hypothetical protein SAMD00020551_1153 [Mesobacillus selenatarsenatis SF-1]
MLIKFINGVSCKNTAEFISFKNRKKLPGFPGSQFILKGDLK